MKYIKEIKRKAIHLSSLWIPMLYLYTDKNLILSLLVPLSILAIMIDLSRKYIGPLNNFINELIGDLMRDDEKTSDSFSGATYLFMSSTLTIFIFTKEVAIFSLLVLMISDSFAALIGKKIGRIKILDKSLEGSISFAISAMIIYYVLVTCYGFSLPLTLSMLAVFAGTMAELVAKKVKLDDNFIIPLAVGVCLL
jgi:dolichol kinase